MENERSANITLGGEEYTLILTTKATKEIAGKYGGLENLGAAMPVRVREMTPVSVPPALSTSRWKGMPAAWAAWAIRSRTGWDTTTDPSMSLRAGPLPRAMGLGGASGQSPAGVTSRAMARSGWMP